MGAVMWLEILGRDHSVTERHRFDDVARWPVRIGRAPDNDIVLDDPHVAPHHAEVRMSADGRLQVVDLGSLNGLQVDGSRERFAQVVCSEHAQVILGRSRIRVRDGRETVAAELPLEPAHHAGWRVLVLGTALLGISVLDLWLQWTTTTPVNHFLFPLLSYTVLLAAWTSIWSVLSRIFAGQVQFATHLGIALGAALAFKLWREVQDWLAFALAQPAIQELDIASLWIFLGVACVAHIRVMLPKVIPLARVLIIAGMAGAIALQWVMRNDGLRQTGHSAALGDLMPPALGPARGASVDEFAAKADQLRQRLEDSRKREPDDGSGDGSD